MRDYYSLTKMPQKVVFALVVLGSSGAIASASDEFPHGSSGRNSNGAMTPNQASLKNENSDFSKAELAHLQQALLVADAQVQTNLALDSSVRNGVVAQLFSSENTFSASALPDLYGDIERRETPTQKPNNPPVSQSGCVR